MYFLRLPEYDTCIVFDIGLAIATVGMGVLTVAISVLIQYFDIYA